MTLHNPEGQSKLNPKSEADARHSSQLLQQLTVGIYHTDAFGHLLYANPAFCRFIGLDWEQLSGRSIQSLIAADYQAQYAQQVDLLLKTGRPNLEPFLKDGASGDPSDSSTGDSSTDKPSTEDLSTDSSTGALSSQLSTEQTTEIHLEQQYLLQNGQSGWAKVILSVTALDTPLDRTSDVITGHQPTKYQPAQILAVVLPCNFQGNPFNQSELRRSEEKFAKTFRSNPDAISIATLSDSRYIDINDGFLRMFEYRREEVIGHTCFELNLWLHIADAETVRQRLISEQAIRGQEYQCRTQSGRPILVLYSAELITLDNEPCILAFRKDITEYRRTERLMVQQAERDRLLTQMTQRIRQSLDLDEILNTAVLEIRQILKTDRVIVYQIPAEGDGEVIVESVDSHWPSMMGQIIADPAGMADPHALAAEHGDSFDELEQFGSELPELEYTHLLEQFSVQSNLVIPIFAGDVSWGFLEVHHCSARRQWQPWEVNLLTQLSDQLSIAIQQSQLYMKLREANHELQRIALLDGLTRIANRRCFNSQLEQEWRRSAREQQPLSLLLCDIDYFKPYNDHYGHPAGDQCLIDVAQALVRASRRPADLVARYGGEEFAVILPNTNQSGAVRVAQAMKTQIKRLNIPHKFSKISPRITMSMGIATIIPRPNSSYEPLIKAADDALYAAKLQGRDRISCYRWNQQTNALTSD